MKNAAHDTTRAIDKLITLDSVSFWNFEWNALIYEPISKRLAQYIAVLSAANTEDIALGTARDLTKILKKIQKCYTE